MAADVEVEREGKRPSNPSSQIEPYMKQNKIRLKTTLKKKCHHILPDDEKKTISKTNNHLKKIFFLISY